MKHSLNRPNLFCVIFCPGEKLCALKCALQTLCQYAPKMTRPGFHPGSKIRPLTDYSISCPSGYAGFSMGVAQRFDICGDPSYPCSSVCSWDGPPGISPQRRTLSRGRRSGYCRTILLPVHPATPDSFPEHRSILISVFIRAHQWTKSVGEYLDVERT